MLIMISLKGRASLRGLKKCVGCGNWNGIRANSCKNKECEHYIKKSSIKNIPLIDPVELVCIEDGSKLYSVRVRDRGIESRSFVKITDKTLSTDDKGCIIYRNAICYVDTCKYDSNDITISCKHVKFASVTLNKSSVLEVHEHVLSKMCSTVEEREKLWNYYNEHLNKPAVVQRIRFLHVYLIGNVKSEVKYACACKKRIISLAANDSVVLKNDKCDHLIYVMSAILSNDRLMDEFSKHLELFLADNNLKDKFAKLNSSNDVISIANSLSPDDAVMYENDLKNLTTMITDYVDNDNAGSLELTDCHIELMDQFKLTDHIDLCHSDIELKESDLMLTDNIFNNNTIIEIPRTVNVPNLNFISWLESVIERINFSMDFNGDGLVNDLIFMIPDKFFECLRDKFSIGLRRRLPNSTQILQTGRYSGLIQHIWKFNRIEILKHIFSTENVQIQIEQKFIQISPGAYTLVEEIPDITLGTNNFCKIQPSVYKTQLKLDQDSGLVLKWIPNVLKKTKFGELKISFEYSHKKHNQIISKPFTIFK